MCLRVDVVCSSADLGVLTPLDSIRPIFCYKFNLSDYMKENEGGMMIKLNSTSL